MAIVRGCGTRVEGGQYLVTRTSPFGRPLTDFMLDPPLPVPEEMRLAATGVMLFQDAKWGERPVAQVANHVGVEGYPNVADFIEEGRRYGFSTRAEGIDLTLLEPGKSFLWHAHSKALVSNMRDVFPFWTCPKGYESHLPASAFPNPEDLDLAQCCLGCVWSDVDGGVPERDPHYVAQLDFLQASGSTWAKNIDALMIRRDMPSFSYYALRRPEGVTPHYVRAFFLRLPIHGIEVITAEDGSHEKKLERLRAAKLPVLECKE